MKKSGLFSLLLLCWAVFSCQPAKKEMVDYLAETAEDREARMAWWKDARFGMFIHWGAYSVPAGYYKGEPVPGIGEWIMNSARIPIPEYEEFARQFNPTSFNAEEWVRIAKDAGMKYIVITSKHHDGFCLWDSKVSEYDIMDFAPFKRDILKELADACKKEGIALCFYHSIMDWHHPDAKSKTYPWHQSTENPNWENYRETYLKPQLEELITKYDPEMLWFDGEWTEEWTEPQGKDLYNFLRNIKPSLIINNRVGKGRQGMQGMNKDNSYAGDFGTPEQEILESSSTLPWESCMTMNDTWGFKKDDQNWKSAEMLIHNLVDIVAKGGNYLLNVGPEPIGVIPSASVERLAEMGKWIKVNGESIYGVKSVPTAYEEGSGIRYATTKDGATVYATLLAWPGEKLVLRKVNPKEGGKVTLLGSSEAITWSLNAEQDMEIVLPAALQDPAARPCQYAWVLKIEGQMHQLPATPEIVVNETEAAATTLFDQPVTATLTAEGNAAIRYTTDGTTPNSNSPLYEGPISIAKNTQLRAASFEEGKKQSMTAAANFEQVTAKTRAMRYSYYEFEGEIEKLPDFSTMTPKIKGFATHIHYEGLPVRSEFFALVFEGMIEVAKDGEYTFATSSDDGSKLLINNQLLVDNDGNHGAQERSGKVMLKKGKHPIRVEYYNGSGGKSFEATIEGPDMPKQAIPTTLILPVL